MLTLFVIGIIVFTVKLAHFAFKAAWEITKGVLWVIGIPALLLSADIWIRTRKPAGDIHTSAHLKN